MTNTFLTFVRSLALSCLLVAGLAGQAAAAPILSFDPQTTNVNVGDTFSVDLILSNFADFGPESAIFGFAASINFDDSIIDFDSATINPSFSTTSTVASTGSLFLSGTTFFAFLPTNPYTLATLQFTALQTGSSPLAFANTTISTISRRTGSYVAGATPINGTDGLVNVAERVPEPATLALFGMGAALLFVRARMARTRN